jgi:hypothetical protein
VIARLKAVQHTKEFFMKRNAIFTTLLAVVLASGLLFVSCDTGTSSSTPAEPETWSAVTDVNQVNGTWKGSASMTITGQQFVENNGKSWETYKSTIGDDMKVTVSSTDTFTFDANVQTLTVVAKSTATFTGSKISTAWSTIKAIGGTPSITWDDTKYTATEDIAYTLTITDIASWGLEINQNGTKLKIPASYGAPEVIYTKQ